MCIDESKRLELHPTSTNKAADVACVGKHSQSMHIKQLIYVVVAEWPKA